MKRIGQLVFSVALLVRGIALLRLEGSPFAGQDRGDSAYYLAWAGRITEGTWTDGQAFYGLPFYPYWLAAWKFLLGDPVWPALLANVLADAIIAFFIFDITARILGSASDGKARMDPWKCAGVAGLVWVIFQPAAAFSVSLMPNTLGTLAWWFVVRRLLDPRPLGLRAWVGWGVFIGAAAMLSANLLFLLPLLGVRAVIAKQAGFPMGKRIPAAFALIGFGVIAGASPCWIHNYIVARDPVFLSAHSGINFYIGNHEGANGYPRFPPGLRASQDGMLLDSIRLAQEAAGRPLRRSEVSAWWTAQARAYIRAHPTDWLTLLGRKVRNYWSAFQYDDISVITPLREWHVVWPGLGFGSLVLLGLPGLFWGAWRFPGARWVGAALMLHLASLLPVFVTERYRLCAVPALCVGVGLGAWFLAQAITQRRWSAVSGGLVAAAAAGMITFWPSGLENLRALDDFNTARLLVEEGRLDDALPRLERALAAGPNDPGVNFLFGNYWLQRRNIPSAKMFFRRVLELDPTHAGAWNNAALIALEEHNWATAEQFLLRALPNTADAAKVWYLIARARLGAGNLTGGSEALQRALTARPNQSEFLSLRAEIEARLNAVPPP